METKLSIRLQKRKRCEMFRNGCLSWSVFFVRCSVFEIWSIVYFVNGKRLFLRWRGGSANPSLGQREHNREHLLQNNNSIQMEQSSLTYKQAPIIILQSQTDPKYSYLMSYLNVGQLRHLWYYTFKYIYIYIYLYIYNFYQLRHFWYYIFKYIYIYIVYNSCQLRHLLYYTFK